MAGSRLTSWQAQRLSQHDVLPVAYDEVARRAVSTAWEVFLTEGFERGLIAALLIGKARKVVGTIVEKVSITERDILHRVV